MRTFFILILSIISMQIAAQPRIFNIRRLTGFYLDSKTPLSKGQNFLVISNRKDFIRQFGQINKPDTPNFQFDYFIALAMQPTREQWFLDFETRATRAGSYIEVYCNIRYEKHKITYLDHPIVTATIPRFFNVHTINFYDNSTKKLLASIPIK
ncbi:MAG: hypothetical protein JST52_08220 [Bacteroidetes bacterium]|nr:hypothetical protein [Bacteroidota bacterium]MBS1739872.1 hypothetical protein [Bacteroidota bacterium]